jgi:hypothetical protein
MSGFRYGTALFACGDHCGQIIGRTDFERTHLDAGVFGHQPDGVVHVPGFKDENTAQLFLMWRMSMPSSHELWKPVRRS